MSCRHKLLLTSTLEKSRRKAKREQATTVYDLISAHGSLKEAVSNKADAFPIKLLVKRGKENKEKDT